MGLVSQVSKGGCETWAWAWHLKACSRSRAVAAGRHSACPAAVACSSGFAQSLRYPHSCPFVLVCPAGFKVGNLMLRTGFGTGSIFADGLDAQDVQLQAAGWVAGSRVGRRGDALPCVCGKSVE